MKSAIRACLAVQPDIMWDERLSKPSAATDGPQGLSFVRVINMPLPCGKPVRAQKINLGLYGFSIHAPVHIDIQTI